jgi:putative acetyltransferase
MVGKYPIFCNSGGGTLYKAVLEYRVWVHGTRGSDTCRFFDTFEAAKEFSEGKRGAEAPLVLVLQNPWIQWNEDRRDFELVHEDRIAEWQVEWLIRENRCENAEAVIAKLRAEYPNGCNE